MAPLCPAWVHSARPVWDPRPQDYENKCVWFDAKFAVTCFSCNRKFIHWVSSRCQPWGKPVTTRTDLAPALKGPQRGAGSTRWTPG